MAGRYYPMEYNNMAFETLPPILAQALTTKGYENLTEVQASVIEPEAIGRDMIVSAKTGSGKTVAFGLAMAGELLNEEGRLPPPAWPLALVIAPTRELALQVSRELEWLYAGARARIATCVGGMDAARERKALAQGAHIVVGTPGRLRDHLERGALDLSALKTAVLDEADEMLDMGFREDLEGILDATPDGRRTLLFSATMPKPIVALARRYQKDAFQIQSAGNDRGHGDISYQAMTVAPADIENAVVNLLRFHEAETAILFCATRDNVRHLHASLTERGFAAVALSGEHSQNERNHALQALRDKRARVCVATDVAARGIDVPTITHVFNFGLPMKAEDYTHRIGRTGRAGRDGLAITFAEFRDRRRIMDIEQYSRQQFKAEVIPGMEPQQRMPQSRPQGDFGGRGRGGDRRQGNGGGGYRGGNGGGNGYANASGFNDRGARGPGPGAGAPRGGSFHGGGQNAGFGGGRDRDESAGFGRKPGWGDSAPRGNAGGSRNEGFGARSGGPRNEGGFAPRNDGFAPRKGPGHTGGPGKVFVPRDAQKRAFKPSR